MLPSLPPNIYPRHKAEHLLTLLYVLYLHDRRLPDSSNSDILGVISVDDKADYAVCERSNKTSVLSILELAELNGLSTGIVSTARLTHATPATTYAHSVSRRWENDAQVPDKRCKDIGININTQLFS